MIYESGYAFSCILFNMKGTVCVCVRARTFNIFVQTLKLGRVQCCYVCLYSLFVYLFVTGRFAMKSLAIKSQLLNSYLGYGWVVVEP